MKAILRFWSISLGQGLFIEATGADALDRLKGNLTKEQSSLASSIEDGGIKGFTQVKHALH